MVKTDPVCDEVAALEAELARRYRGQIWEFRLAVRDGVVTLYGSAVSFYALQLLLRDVLAAGVASAVHNRISVRTRHTR